MENTNPKTNDSESDTSNIIKDTDRIYPTQLVQNYRDEYEYHNGEFVLGTFTSKMALGMFLSEMVLEQTKKGYSSMNELSLKRIKLNPNYGDKQ